MISTLALWGSLCLAAPRPESVAAAAPAPAETLTTLVDAAMARTGARQVARSVAAIAAAEASLGSLPWAERPGFRMAWLDDGRLDDLGQYEYEAGLSLALWNSGERALQRASAEQRSREAQALERARRWQLAGQIIDLAAGVFEAEAQRRLAERRLAAAREFSAALGRRAEVGDVPDAEAALARIEALQMAAALSAAEGAFEAARAAYGALVGDRPLPPEPPAEAAPPPLPDDWQPHPWLAATLLRVDRLEKQRDLAERGNTRSTLAAGVRREKGDANSPRIDALMLEVTLPIGGDRRARVNAAQAANAAAEARAELIEARRAIERRYGEAAARYRALASQLDALSEGAAAAGQRVAALERAYGLGEVSLESLLRARERLYGLEQQAMLAEHEREHLHLTLQHLVGDLP